MTKHFFVVGAQRTGTTYLYHMLAEHPEIEMAAPLQPEPKFFHLDHLYERGLDYYYSTFFSGKPGAKRLGEKTTTYIESQKAAQRISECFPDAHIIILIRNPIERAISNYWYTFNNGLETLPMAEAFYKEEERWQDYDHEHISASPYAYLRRGCYLEYIEMYERFFPAGQITIIIHEQLFAQPEVIISDVYSTLGVAGDYLPSRRDEKINAAAKAETPLDPALEGYLRAYFAGWNARLAAHLGRNLSAWWG